MDVAPDILMRVWSVLCQMAPYLLLGFLVAGVLSQAVSPRFVETHLGGGGLGPVLKASLLGIPLPLCSCGVIPVGASLRRHGAGKGATTGFLISTPQTGVDSILVTYSLLGGVFAIFRPVVAFVSGVLGGALVNWFGGRDTERPAAPVSEAAPEQRPSIGGRIVGVFHYGFVTLPGDIGRSLLIGLIAAAVITALLPTEMLPGWLGTGIGSMLFMLIIGVPFYVCATASVPIAAALMATETISPGAALVFLMTGPATNGATIATVWKIMGRRSALIYLGAVMGTALASGLVLDAIYAVDGVACPTLHSHDAGLSLYQTVSGIILGVVLAPAVLGPLLRGRLKPAGSPEVLEHMESIALTVNGMTCSHCASSVTRALNECEGVDDASVDLAAGRATVVGEDLDVAALCAAVADLGYEAEVADDGADDEQAREGGCTS